MGNHADQLRIGDHAQPTIGPAFVTDDHIVEVVAQVELGLRQVQAGLEHVEALLPSMRKATGTARSLLDSLVRQLEPPKDRA